MNTNVDYYHKYAKYKHKYNQSKMIKYGGGQRGGPVMLNIYVNGVQVVNANGKPYHITLCSINSANSQAYDVALQDFKSRFKHYFGSSNEYYLGFVDWLRQGNINGHGNSIAIKSWPKNGGDGLYKKQIGEIIPYAGSSINTDRWDKITNPLQPKPLPLHIDVQGNENNLTSFGINPLLGWKNKTIIVTYAIAGI